MYRVCIEGNLKGILSPYWVLDTQNGDIWEIQLGRQICATEHWRGLASQQNVAALTVPRTISSCPSGCPVSDFTISGSRVLLYLGASMSFGEFWGSRCRGYTASSIRDSPRTDLKQVTQAARNSKREQPTGRLNDVQVSSESLKLNGNRNSWLNKLQYPRSGG